MGVTVCAVQKTGWNQFLKCFLLNVELLTVKVAIDPKLDPSSAAQKRNQFLKCFVLNVELLAVKKTDHSENGGEDNRPHGCSVLRTTAKMAVRITDLTDVQCCGPQRKWR
ncbi:hypothetical protein M514_20464 [Trichuris suis]|uniref:Uncharacterized protein n=1 Tax=Trichuris suis TaxID=68888 RepID=A0A085ND82_9BILA|nr:hypothetical protein M514_20464 [Trichuris suis]